MNGTLTQNLLAASELLVGFVIVLATLTLLWGLTALMARLIARLEAPQKAAAARPTTTAVAAAPSASADTGPSDEEVAVIAAAVALLIAAPHRIVRVQPQPSAWGEEGRRDTHASHRRR